MKTFDAIIKIPIFSSLSSEQLKSLSTIVSEKSFKKGETIFSQGDEAIGFYAVLSGLVKIFKLSPNGKEQILHVFGNGNIFGEVPMFSGEKFPANAVAIEKSRLLFFPKRLLLKLIKEDATIAMKMLSELSSRLRYFAQLVEDLSLKEVPARLAAYILYLSNIKGGSNDITLSITKGQLSSLLGTTPETISRILSKLNNNGFIQMHGKKIRIIDHQGLEAISSGKKIENY